MTLADYELWIRRAVVGTVGTVVFDPATDVEGMTINRRPHGYALPVLRFVSFVQDGQVPA